MCQWFNIWYPDCLENGFILFVSGVGAAGVGVWIITFPALMVLDGIESYRRAKSCLGGPNRGRLLKAWRPDVRWPWQAISRLKRKQSSKEESLDAETIMRQALFNLRASRSAEIRAISMDLIVAFHPSGAFEAIAPWLDASDRRDVIKAARSLLNLDLTRGLPLVLDRYVIRRAITRDALGILLSKIVPARLEEPFMQVLLNTPVESQVRLVEALPFLGEWGQLMPLQTFQPLRDRSLWLVAAMRLVNSSNKLPLVRPYLRHPDATVRLYAVKAIGRYGTLIDLPSLKLMMYRETAAVRRAANLACVSLIGRHAALSE
jgi:hypothetical protein